MHALTVGVPTYNRADRLDAALDNIASQTFKDLEIWVYDNASTDQTEAVVQAWVKRDPRVRYYRQPVNKGPLANFRDVANAARSPYFAWRADDDFSDLDYFEKLHALLEAHREADLAVGRVEALRAEGGVARVHLVPDLQGGPEPLRVVRALFGSHPSWFYGLWKTAAIQAIFEDVCTHFPLAWGSDHLTLYGPLVDGRVIGSNAVGFFQTLPPKKLGRSKRTSFLEMQTFNRAFAAQEKRLRGQREVTGLTRLLLLPAGLVYVHRHRYKFGKLARSWARARMAPIDSRSAT